MSEVKLSGARVLMVTCTNIVEDARVARSAKFLSDAGADVVAVNSKATGAKFLGPYEAGPVVAIKREELQLKLEAAPLAIMELLEFSRLNWLEKIVVYGITAVQLVVCTVQRSWKLVLAFVLTAYFLSFIFENVATVLQVPRSGPLEIFQHSIVAATLVSSLALGVWHWIGVRYLGKNNSFIKLVIAEAFNFMLPLATVKATYQPALEKQLERHDFDFIFAHDLNALIPALAARNIVSGKKNLTGLRIIFDAHEYAETQDGLTQLRRMILKTALSRRAMKDVDGGMTVSPWLARHYTEKYGISFMFVPSAPQSVSWDGKNKQNLRQVLGLSPRSQLIIHIGGINERRGSLELARALAHVSSEVNFCFISNAKSSVFKAMEEVYRSERQKSGKGAQVWKVAAVPPTDIINFCKEATASVVTRLPERFFFNPQREYAFPNKLNESLHCGLPLILGDCYAHREIVDKWGIGLVANLRKPALFAAAIERVAKSPTEFKYTQTFLDYIRSEYSHEAARHNFMRVMAAVCAEKPKARIWN